MRGIVAEALAQPFLRRSGMPSDAPIWPRLTPVIRHQILAI